MTSRRLRPRQPHLFEGLFGGGGGGGGGSSKFYKWYKNYILDQQADQELSEERVNEQAETQTEYRRNEIADRTGYAGLVTVGPAAQDTDATLAARMAILDPADPQRQTYDAAIADEAKKKAQATRIITGEQYDVEDKFSALTKNLAKDASAEDIQKALDQYGTLSGQYDWFEGGASIQDDLNKRLKKRKDADALAASYTPPSPEMG